MDILSALQQSQAKSNNKEIPNSSDYITDAVWECTLYRLGFDERYYKDIPAEEREDFLNRLEKQK
jgi:hypothetical protein